MKCKAAQEPTLGIGFGNGVVDAHRLKKYPGIRTGLHELLKEAPAGDPITGLKGTRQTGRGMTRELRRPGFKVKRESAKRSRQLNARRST